MSATSPLPTADLSFQVIPDGDRGKERNYNGWLHVLEQAQWERSQRYENAEIRRMQHTPRSDADAHEKSLNHQSDMLDSEGRKFFSTAASRGRTNGENQASATSGVPASDFPVARTSGAGCTNFVLPPTSAWEGVSRENSDRVSGQNVQPSRWNTTRSETQQWPAQRVHALFDGVGLHVWVRDANLEPGVGLKLLSTFRRQLMETGVSLASLTLNGQLVKFPFHVDG